MRLPAILLALALAALPVLAGCVGSASATAMNLRTPADEAARAWDPDAQLAKVVGVEGVWVGSLFWGAGDFKEARDDEAVGDGQCEIWKYRYVAPGQDEAFVVLVGRDGKIISKDTAPRDDGDVPLGAWTIDSDRALEIAKQASDGLRRGVASESFGIVASLERDADADAATWIVAGGGGDASGGGGGVVILDAETGKVISARSGTSDA